MSTSTASKRRTVEDPVVLTMVESLNYMLRLDRDLVRRILQHEEPLRENQATMVSSNKFIVLTRHQNALDNSDLHMTGLSFLNSILPYAYVIVAVYETEPTWHLASFEAWHRTEFFYYSQLPVDHEDGEKEQSRAIH